MATEGDPSSPRLRRDKVYYRTRPERRRPQGAPKIKNRHQAESKTTSRRAGEQHDRSAQLQQRNKQRYRTAGRVL